MAAALRRRFGPRGSRPIEPPPTERRSVQRRLDRAESRGQSGLWIAPSRYCASPFLNWIFISAPRTTKLAVHKAYWPPGDTYSMRTPIFYIDAFAVRRFAGNPAAVMPMDRFLADATLQCIAAENNLAETAFLVHE